MKSDSLSATVQSLHRFYEQSQLSSSSASTVRAEAQRLGFPDPDLAARVAGFLWRGKRRIGDAFTADDVSEAFLAAIADEDSAIAQAKNPWVHWRAVVRDAGRQLGIGLQEIWDVVSAFGFGYEPSLATLARELSDALGEGDERAAALGAREAAGELEPWKAALGRAWLGWGGEAEPSIGGLAHVLLSAELRREFEAHPGPWGALEAQARSIASHGGVAQALAALASNV